MKAKRTGHDVLRQLHSVMQLAQSHPAWVEKAALAMTPEQLRRAQEGLNVLAHCIAEQQGDAPAMPAMPALPATPVAAVVTPAAPKAARQRPQPAIESS
ncbi:hypothetical protein [Piscinibacter terrae]|uniref:Uncharacterized protein n=1 Tax=Piscinibacter terrae TaxID=2496871 RepID=A0A3N7HUA7_9BURK|nr:hypothetical protein [Albitalea terrae]RQP24501.1 hypothetical protein DZC73_14550 [Albitalea terrae]